MKIRNGFVSNSSSSSYVIVLPDNFKLKTKSVPVIREFNELRKAKSSVSGNSRNVDAWFDLLLLLENYTVSTTHAQPGNGDKMILISNDKIREVWSK